MSYPTMAPGDTWYRGITPKSEVTSIIFMDSSSAPSGVEMWYGDIENSGSIVCNLMQTGYINDNGEFVFYEGYTLVISGNGSGKISLNENSCGMFGDAVNWTNYFTNLRSISNTNLLDFSLVKDMRYLLYNCTSLTNIDVSEWDISGVTNIASMFADCTNLVTVDVSNWDVNNVTSLSGMFSGCTSLVSVDLSKWNLNKDVVYSFSQMFYNCKNLTSVGDWSNWDIQIGFLRLMFANCRSLTEVSFGKFTATSNDPNVFISLFTNCNNLKTVRIKELNLLEGTSFDSLFSNCKVLETLDINIDFSKVIDISFMLYGCTGLKEIDVSNWDVSNVTNFDHFAAHANLKRKGIEKWNTSSAINMNAMFHNCAEEELDLSGYDVSKVKYFCQMFENSPNLKRVKGLEKWDTSSGVGFDEMFGRCRKLEEVDLSSFDTSKAKNGEAASTNGHKTNTFSNFFQECNSLKKIALGSKFSINGDGTNTSIAKKLIFPTPSATYIQEADGNWYDIEGNSYAPDDILDRTAKTYYAVLSEAFDSDTVPVMVNRGSLTKVAHALRKKTGKTDKLKLNSFSEEIKSFEGEMLVLDDNTTIEDETLIIGGA